MLLTVTIILVVAAVAAALLDKPSYGVFALAVAIALQVLPK
jgi:hypothetical protein